MRIRALLSAIFNPIRECHHVWSIIQLGGDEKFERAEKLCTTLRTYKVHLRQVFRRTSPLWSIRNQTGRGQFDRCELVNFLNARGRRLRDGRYSSRPLNAAEFRPISISSLVDNWKKPERRRRNDEMIVEETINRIVVADNVDRQNEFRHRSSFKYLASRSLTRLNEIAIASAIIPITWLVRRAMRRRRQFDVADRSCDTYFYHRNTEIRGTSYRNPVSYFRGETTRSYQRALLYRQIFTSLLNFISRFEFHEETGRHSRSTHVWKKETYVSRLRLRGERSG